MVLFGLAFVAKLKTLFNTLTSSLAVSAGFLGELILILSLSQFLIKFKCSAMGKKSPGKLPS